VKAGGAREVLHQLRHVIEQLSEVSELAPT